MGYTTQFAFAIQFPEEHEANIRAFLQLEGADPFVLEQRGFFFERSNIKPNYLRFICEDCYKGSQTESVIDEVISNLSETLEVPSDQLPEFAQDIGALYMSFGEDPSDEQYHHMGSCCIDGFIRRDFDFFD